MKHQNSSKILFHFVMVLSAVLIVQGCSNKPKLTGADEKFVTSGSADDGALTTGPGIRYYDPNRTAKDGRTEAISDPQNYKSLRGSASAIQDPFSIDISTAMSTNKATSTFVVTKPFTGQFILSSTASVNITKGRAGYTVLARILDSIGIYVGRTDFQTRFDFKPKGNDSINVFENGNRISTIKNSGFISPTDVGPSPAFTLNPGRYTLVFELNINAVADTVPEYTPEAIIKVSANVDFK